MESMKAKNPADSEDVTLVRIKPKKAETKVRDLVPKKDVKGGSWGATPPAPKPPPPPPAG